MASSFPGAIDSFSNPLASSPLNSPSHAAQHQDLNDAINKAETYMGLVKIIPTGATNGTVGATGTVTIGNAVTSVTINGAFSSLYDNYIINASGGTTSTNTNIDFKLGSVSSGYRFNYVYGSYASGTPALSGTTTGTNIPFVGFGNTTGLIMSATILSPFLTTPTGVFADGGSFGNFTGRVTGFEPSSTSFTSFVISLGSGTMTGGTITIYGYRK